MGIAILLVGRGFPNRRDDFVRGKMIFTVLEATARGGII
jgi:hypothetical protein